MDSKSTLANSNVSQVLTAYEKVLNDSVSAYALLKEKDFVTFLLLQLSNGDEDSAFKSLKLLNDICRRLGSHKKMLFQSYGFQETLKIASKRFTDKEDHLKLCKALLSEHDKFRSSSKNLCKMVKIHFYECLDNEVSDLISATFAKLDGVVSVTFNMRRTEASLRVRLNVKKCQIESVLCECGVDKAELGLMKNGIEERILIGHRDTQTDCMPEYLPDDFIPSPPKKEVDAYAVCTGEQLNQRNDHDTGLGIGKIVKGFSSMFRKYF